MYVSSLPFPGEENVYALHEFFLSWKMGVVEVEVEVEGSRGEG